MVGGGTPGECRSADLARLAFDQAAQAVDEPSHRRLAADRLGTEAVHLGDEVARAGRVDGGQFVPQGGDKVALGAGHLKRSDRSSGPPFVA
jgi:hypothetical protein